MYNRVLNDKKNENDNINVKYEQLEGRTLVNGRNYIDTQYRYWLETLAGLTCLERGCDLSEILGKDLNKPVN